MKTIIAPIDFSRVSQRVVAEAAALAQATGARVALLHAFKPPGIVKHLAPLAGDTLQFTAEVGRGARRSLRQVERRLAGRKVAVEVICELGKPVDVILESVERLAPTYIVIGSHGHSALYDLVVGSTTSGVLQGARCAVVVVPARSGRTRRRLRTESAPLLPNADALG